MPNHLNPRVGAYLSSSLGGETVRAYLPKALPPHPPLDLARLLPLIERAHQALGRLDGITSILPASPLFLYMYVRKETLLSSQIEGTQSSLSDLLMYEFDGTPLVPLDDVVEVSNYVAAMEHGLKRLRDGFLLSLRLCATFTGFCSHLGAAVQSSPASFAPLKIGSAVHGPETHCSFRRPPSGLFNVWMVLSAI